MTVVSTDNCHAYSFLHNPAKFKNSWMPLHYRDDEMLKEAVWRDRQQISIWVELTVCQKNVANALNSVEIILKNKVYFAMFPFFFMVELQNFLNAPRIWTTLKISSYVCINT